MNFMQTVFIYAYDFSHSRLIFFIRRLFAPKSE